MCYPHGAAGYSTDLLTVDDGANNGTWYTYINGDQREGQSGYTNTLHIAEWGEYTNYFGVTCSGWSASVTFNPWQRYNYATNTWTTVQEAQDWPTTCWSVSVLSDGYFTASH